MIITVNDTEKQVADGITLAELLVELQVPEKGTAVALNDKIARKDTWTQIALSPNDKILIISAAYGG